MTKNHYNEGRTKRSVSFNEKEKDLLEFSKTFDFSKWVKSELAKKMTKNV